MSVAQDFRAFVQRQQQKAAEEHAIDWNARKQEWLEYLDTLYDDIETYLKEYIQSGAISLKKSQIELNEENIGTYNASRLFIDIGPQQISLTPVGTLLIGTKDVSTSRGVRGVRGFCWLIEILYHQGFCLMLSSSSRTAPCRIHSS